MATTLSDQAIEADPRQGVRTNDIIIKIATPNGSGSQSANLILLRSFFELGIPVSGKNLFPSNIQGLPTWFTIRVNGNGWLAARRRVDLFIAMNPDTLQEDVAGLEPGTIVLIDKTYQPMVRRNDLIVYAAPFNDLVTQVCEVPKLRKMVVNILYVGVVAQLLGIALADVEKAIDWQFGKKPSAAALNKTAAAGGYQWAAEHLEPQSQFRIERSDAARGKIIIEGNEAAALGMLFGGVTVVSWYPITPSSSLCEALQKYLAKYRRDPETNKATYAVVQAEDEIAAMGVVLGAGWAGARAFTATAGPGLSLMAEMAGLSYFAEIPAVIVDVQRMGPSTGLPTRTSQGDLAKAYNLSHGDCKHLMLIPGNAEECYEFARLSLDFAERFQTLVLVMSDLDLGMNKWLSDPFNYPDEPLDRGKVLTLEDLEQNGDFARYRDVDGDGIPWRTLPGTDHPKAAYFTRGTGHSEQAVYTENPVVWKANMDRLARKFETARATLPPPIIDAPKDAEVGLIAYGSSDLAVEEARAILAEESGVSTAYLRLRALPASAEVEAFAQKYGTIYVIEQNRDAQLANILRAEFPQLAHRFTSILHYNGFPIDADTIVEQYRALRPAQEARV